jgi:hypothetical protein
MNEAWLQKFESKYGCPPPLELRQLLENDELVHAVPVQFRFADKPFVVEIQYFCFPDTESNYDILSKCYRFGVSSDGNDLLVDFKNNDLPVFQRESGLLDDIGVTIRDLLNALVAPM